MKNDTGVSGTLIDLIIHFISSCSEHLWLASLSLIRGTTVDWFSCFWVFFTHKAHTLSATAHSSSSTASMSRFVFDMHGSMAARTLRPNGLGTNE